MLRCNEVSLPSDASGQERPIPGVRPMSAAPLEATELLRGIKLCNGPKKRKSRRLS
jgi:hypothetical protein